ncbi:hypothetical protein PR202_gb19073 [Eleusine coracana subsp. coracana]|uniref:F-box domain-containing protein n=1 Tax=Eleusine coracana subsp. coracana TaxID=191504 RepID=A0AAV5F7A1_ELECO|nr:hypothetical protein PR202_gb19073 [Eleusine coracana subsp. coracana]
MDSVGDSDRISALPDDLLHQILAAVGDAVTVTRTAVLSRRWRNVWTHAQRLVLVDQRVIRGTKFEDFVDWVFAQRGNADIDSLDINYKCRYLNQYPAAAGIPHERINRWLRYATQCVVESLNIDLPYYYHEKSKIKIPMAATAKYEALTELSLFAASFDEEELGGVRTLGDFVSSCCPRLRKLDIQLPERLQQLVLHTESLEELNLYCVEDLRTLDVTAPNLRVLKLKLACCLHESAVKVSAKRLEEVEVHLPQEGVSRLDMVGLTCVRRLGSIGLYFHGQHYGPDRGGGWWLLENCPAAEHVKVSLGHWEASNVTDGELVDLTSFQGAPLTFPSVGRMEVTVKAHQFPEGHLVASMSSLLLRTLAGGGIAYAVDLILG